MSPFTEDDVKGAADGINVWRALIILALVLIAGTIAFDAVGFFTNRSAINDVRALNCRIGAFFIDQPIERQPEQTADQFQKIVRSAQIFLHSLEDQGCEGVKGADISTAKIQKALRGLHRVDTTHVKGGGRSSGTSPPTSSTGGGPPVAPPPPSTPPPPSPGPPGGTTTIVIPPPKPPPTTTTPKPPPTKPPPTTTPTQIICHLNPLGIRICVRL